MRVEALQAARMGYLRLAEGGQHYVPATVTAAAAPPASARTPTAAPEPTALEKPTAEI